MPPSLVIMLALSVPLLQVRVTPPLRAQHCAASSLALAEAGAQPLPATFGIEGVTVAVDGAVTLWSAEGEVIGIEESGGVSRRRLPDSIRPVGIVAREGGLRLLDRASGREYRLGPDGAPPVVLGRVPLSGDQRLDQAVWYDGAWVVGILDERSRRFLAARMTGDSLAVVYRSPPGDSPRTIPRYRMSPGRASLLLTRLTPPFEVVRVSGARDDAAPVVLPIPAAGIAPDDRLVHWRALPAIEIDCAVLLTLSDLASDRRLLLRLDPAGRLEKVTELEAPFGLVTALPGAARLLAARRAGGLELVWYDWRWVRVSQGSH